MNTHIKFDAYLSNGGKMTKRQWNLAGRPTADTPFLIDPIPDANNDAIKKVIVRKGQSLGPTMTGVTCGYILHTNEVKTP